MFSPRPLFVLFKYFAFGKTSGFNPLLLLYKPDNKLLPKKMQRIHSLFFFLIAVGGFSQTLPPSRSVDWTLAGLRDTTTVGFQLVDMQAEGVVGDGIAPNDSIVNNVISSIVGPGAILNFPSGNFLFNNTIDIPSNIIVRGQGADNTTFTMNLGGTGHSFNIQGNSINADTNSLIESAIKDSSFVIASDPAVFTAGDWLQIVQIDSDLVTSLWAKNTVGQIAEVKTIVSNKIVLESPLRMDFDISRSPHVSKIVPVKNVGLECLKIHRIDDTAPEQSSNVSFSYAVNCWVMGIESENCTFSHIQAIKSSNLYVSGSYIHDGFDYGGDGRAYGVMLQATSNECLAENNVFEHLRHSMILQSGANGNVFAYNYSFDPYWDSAPNDASGDLVLHGNYPYANLFEQNICQNIVIDDSHGPNGPYNTIFRNRAEGFGVFFSANNSPDQNLLGNEIPNTNFPYSLVNYTIQGVGHFIYSNNNKGVIHPTGTNTLSDISYAYAERPDFVPIVQWAGIGTPNSLGSASIPAYDRYASGTIFSNACNDLSIGVAESFEGKENILIFPNPLQSKMIIKSSHYIENLTVVSLLGQVIFYRENIGFSNHINTLDWRNGVYFVLINFSNNKSVTEIAVKTNSF